MEICKINGIEPLKDAYLRTSADKETPGKQEAYPNIYVFSVIGIFILVIAVTDRLHESLHRRSPSNDRRREVGVRKVDRSRPKEPDLSSSLENR